MFHSALFLPFSPGSDARWCYKVDYAKKVEKCGVFFLPFWTSTTKAHTPTTPQNCNFDWKELKLGAFDVCNRLSIGAVKSEEKSEFVFLGRL